MKSSHIITRAGIILGGYIELMKPRILSLLVFTAVTGTVLASANTFELSVSPFIATVLGGILAAGGASALNIALETDLDKRMPRTSKRPVTASVISRTHAIIFGLVLNTSSFVAIFLLTGHLPLNGRLLAASLAIIGSILYVGLYTLILKRNTWHNIVVGGAAGAVPPLVGYAAFAGELHISAWYLAAIIFFWTPPHFWALALLIKDDYAKADVPMLPVVKGNYVTRLQILLYTLLMAGLTTAFYPVANLLRDGNDLLGGIYLIGSAMLNIIFILLAVLLMRNYTRKAALRLYLFSLLYLFLLFGLIMVDVRIDFVLF